MSKDYKDITEIQITRKIKVTKKDVKGGLQLFYRESKESNGKTFTTIKPLTIELVAKKHGISEDDVKDSIVRMIKTKPKQQQKIMKKAVEKMYGISL